MKKWLILLLLIPVLSYSQNIGSKLPKDLIESMEFKQTETCKIYTSFVNDSMTVIGVDIRDNAIFSIDYILLREKWQISGYKWINKYKLIGREMYYDTKTGDFYFVVYLENLVYIQRRNASRI